MNCFMGFNPNVAKQVKVTTWVKELDGASPVYPSLPGEGDVFIVFDSDESAEPSVNKTYTNGEWADTSSGGGGGGGDYPTFTCTRSGDDVTVTCDKTYDECLALIEDGPSIDFPTLVADDDSGGDGTYFAAMSPEARGQVINVFNYLNQNYIVYANDGTLSYVVG